MAMGGERRRVEVSAALRLWAELASAEQANPSYEVAGHNDLAWLGLEVKADLIKGPPEGFASTPEGVPSRVAERPDVARLTRLDALHDNEYLLRLGWVLLVGTVVIDGERQRVVQPLLTRPVSIRRRSLLNRALGSQGQSALDEYSLELHGETEANRIVDDASRRAHVAGLAEFGGGALVGGSRHDERILKRLPRLQGWIRDSALAMGLPTPTLTLSPPDWRTAFDGSRLRAHVGNVLFIARDPTRASVSTSLQNWAGRSDLERTALGAILGHADREPEPADHDERVDLPIELSASQEGVVRTARRSPVTVLSGAPGTGKTHTLCAVAVDTVARGASVLIATHSRAAADAVTDLLDRTPGPDPVRFGEGAGIARVVDELEQRRAAPLAAAEVESRRAAAVAACARRDSVADSIAEQLRTEANAAEGAELTALLPSMRRDAPGLFEPTTSLTTARTLLESARRRGGWFSGLRARRSERELRRVAGAAAGTDLARIATALDAAVAADASARLAVEGGTQLGAQWDLLAVLDEAARRSIGQMLDSLPHDPVRLRRGGAAAVSDLITALRAGRESRRDLLASLPVGAFTTVAPLWIGTLADVEDVLPATAGLFDLVILDEASHIEQSRAAGALLRGRRALVVGDPRQLQHTSFMADARLDAVLGAHGLTEARSVLDVRRVTAFDLAAAVGEPLQLREHFRSEPHLIGFSLERFYRDQVALMTTSPATETTDCIHTVAAGEDDVAAAVAVVESLVADGAHDIGVVTPFRDVADRLESSLGAMFDAEEIRSLRLRVGTVHGFQGSERDVMVVVPGLRADDPAGRHRFVADPHLFNVMVTRARHRCVVVTSMSAQGESLLAAYLRHADRGPQPPPGSPAPDRWTAELASGLRVGGLAVRTGYPVGPWCLDIVIGGPDGEPVAVETRVHPSGAATHIARRRALQSLGWTITDAHVSRFDGDAARAVVELVDELT